tara:strand:+ start:1073 stop:1285 length:213 start_codon:yes stop_codon:yes gene_type:complete
MKFGVFALPALSGGDGRRLFSFLMTWFKALHVVDPYWWISVGANDKVPEQAPGLLLQDTDGDPNSAFFRV